MRSLSLGLVLFCVGAAMQAIAHGVSSPWFWLPIVVAIPVVAYAVVQVRRG